MEMTKGKVFQKPDAGMFFGTVVDVVDMPNYPTGYGPQNKVRILWILNKMDNTPALDNEGKLLTIAEFHNAKTAENGNLMKAIRQILNGPAPLLNSTEEVAQLLIGRSCELFLIKAPNQKNPSDPYTNINGHAPLQPGQIPPRIPVDFVREINKPKMVGGATTYATPQAAAYATQQLPAAPAPYYTPPQPTAPPQPVYSPPPPQPTAPPQPVYSPRFSPPPPPQPTYPHQTPFCPQCGDQLPNHNAGCLAGNNVSLNPPGQPTQRPF